MIQTNTFLFPIPTNYLSGVKVIEQPNAEVMYEVDESFNVNVTHISFHPSTLKYLVDLEWLFNDIHQAALNNAQPDYINDYKIIS